MKGDDYMQKNIKYISAFMGLCVIIGTLASVFIKKPGPIKVGVLHSLTGHMAISEIPVVNATLFAIEEINANGGFYNRPIEPIVLDGASNDQTFAEQAEVLIRDKKVEVIFGCWTSSSRKEVKEVVEKYNHLLFYPVQYEGIEQSPNIIYTGSSPNQQMFPAVMWCIKNIGKRFFIVGSDYVYSRISAMIVAALLYAVNAELVGEEYIPFKSTDVSVAIEKIKNTHPDVIINMINGDTNIPFFTSLRAAGITSEEIPTLSFSIGEPEIKVLGPALTQGDYAAWSYFQSLDTYENRVFVENFKKKFGSETVINDPMEAAYVGVYLWFEAATAAGDPSPKIVREHMPNQSRVVPEGNVAVDCYNNHTWRPSRLGKINKNGQFDIIWSSGKSLYPVTYPFKSSEEWETILQELYTQWGGKWSKD